MTQATVDAVKAALKAVKEPILGRDIVSLGMVKKVEVEKDFAYIQIDLPTPAAASSRSLSGLLVYSATDRTRRSLRICAAIS